HCPVPGSGRSPQRVASGPSKLSVAPALTISSLCTQQATAEGEQLSWLSEKRLLSQRLERLQRAVAKLQLEKTELKQLNAELRRTLEQEESHTCCSCRLAELQKQVSLLQTQLAQERKYKQDYPECCAKTSQELSDLHHELSLLLTRPSSGQGAKAAVLEAETGSWVSL
ncbi:centrosome-associated protein CEP250-like, partial [Grus americana]|uniref:centrosome-associated protein CEP250-like n=1 Tax=Grus americana TaxID=9117 RepID=UPI002408720D